MFAFAGQIFQFVDRPGNVDNYGFNFTLRHPLSLWKAQNEIFENSVLRPKCIRPKCIVPKYFRAEVGIMAKYYWGQSIPWAEMCLGPKYAWSQSECGAKVFLGPNWV